MKRYTLTSLRRSFPLAVLLLTAFLGLVPLGLQAQVDEYSIPGLDDAPATTQPSLTDGGQRSAPAPQKTTLFTLIAAGGWAMWILGLLSITLIALATYLSFEIQKKNFFPPGLDEQIGERLTAMDLDGSIAVTEASDSVLAKSMTEGLNLIYDRGLKVLETDSLLEVITEASIKGNRHRAKLVNYFSTIAQSAPMVGLLGTVSGMIKAFGKLGQEGMGDPSGLAANISEALVTTATGLVVALPALFFYSFYRDKLQEMIVQTDEISASLVRKLIDAYQAYKVARGEATKDTP